MDIQYFKKRLLNKERELLSDIARFESEARRSGDAEVGDPLDKATVSEGKSTSFEESNLEWQTLLQVRDALQRIQSSTYGRCIDCGRQIDMARLEAIPWTPYCREDREKHDSAALEQGSSTL